MNRPRFDTYSKAVLTVIAVCLVWLCLERTQIIPQADAQVKPGDADKVHDVVKARSFIVVDEKGRQRAVLSATKYASVFMLADEKGQTRFGLVSSELGAVFTIYDEKRQRVALKVTKDGPSLELNDEQGHPRSSLVVTKDGPMFALADEKGNRRAAIGAIDLCESKTAESSILLFDKDEKVLWQAPPR